jgi:hypothetical protein
MAACSIDFHTFKSSNTSGETGNDPADSDNANSRESSPQDNSYARYNSVCSSLRLMIHFLLNEIVIVIRKRLCCSLSKLSFMPVSKNEK